MRKKNEDRMIYPESSSTLIHLKETSQSRRGESNRASIRHGTLAAIAMAMLVAAYGAL
jgi:hypothetical protein